MDNAGRIQRTARSCPTTLNHQPRMEGMGRGGNGNYRY